MRVAFSIVVWAFGCHREDVQPPALDAFDACEASEAVVLATSEMQIEGLAVLADDDGWVVFWASTRCECAPDQHGLFAARPGQQPVRISDLPSPGVEAVVVEDGFLVCWATVCGIVSPDLELLEEPFEPPGFYARIGQGLYSFQYRDETSSLAAVTERGTQRGSAIGLPCGPSGWSDERLACTRLSYGDRCSVGLNTLEGDCRTLLQLVDLDGEIASREVDVGPAPNFFGGWNKSTAGTPDSLAVGWDDADGIHARVFDESADLQGVLDIAEPEHTARLFTTGNHFVLTWVRQRGRGSGLRYVLFDAEGTPLDGPHWVTAERPGHEGFVRSVGSHDDGWAMAWIGEDGLNQTAVWSVNLRRLGCP